MRRPAVVIGSALLGLVVLWVVLLWPPSGSVAPHAQPVAAPSALALGGPAAPAAPAAQEPTAAARRGTPPAAAAPPRATAATTAPRKPGPGVVSAPPARPGPTPSAAAARPARYVFAPAATSSGPAPSTDLKLSDLSLHSGQVLTWDVTMGSPGALLFDAHTASSSASAGSYPLADLHSCVEYVGERPCTPVATPQPAYWAVTAADLARHTRYRVRVLATANSSLLAGMRVAWSGPDDVTVAGAALPGGCQANVGKGYVAGCGLKYKLVTTGPTALIVTTATTGLQISLKNTTSNAKVYSGPLVSPQSMQVPSAGEWTGHLYPTNGSPVASTTVTFSWK